MLPWCAAARSVAVIRSGLSNAKTTNRRRTCACSRRASLSGPPGLRLIKGFHDEALAGKWEGFRSSQIGLQRRVIYRLVAEDFLFREGWFHDPQIAD